MPSERCVARFYGVEHDFNGTPCGDTATIKRNDKWYCAVHDPNLHKELWAKTYARGRRQVACTAAFESPDGRSIPTEQIEPGLVWDLHDHLEQALRQWSMYAELDGERDLGVDPNPEGDMYRAAKTLLRKLSSLQPKRGV